MANPALKGASVLVVDDSETIRTCAGMFLAKAGKGLPELGKVMVGSKEWKAQIVNFYFRVFFGRGLATSESDYYLSAARTFETSGFRAKALIKHLVTSPAYCAR